jgi:hypothetical protein
MNATGALLGLAAIAIIGLGFVWVISAERNLGWAWWPWFMLAGFVVIIISILVGSRWLSALLGIFGASLVWGATEFRGQAVRTSLGWYPAKEGGKIRPPCEGLIRKMRAPGL